MMRPGDKTWYVLGENAQFNTNEFVFIKGVDLDQIFANPTGFPGLKGVIGDPEVMQKTIGNLGAAAGQKRRAGRILFGANVAKYRQAVNAQFDKCKVISGMDKTTVLIFSGLAGGTGSGSIVDVVAQTRKIDQFNNESTPIVVFPMIPEVTPPGGCDAGRYHANGYAALQELNALMVGAYKPFDLTGLSPTGRVEFGGIKRIANGLMVYSDVNENGYTVNPHTELPQIVSDFAFARVFMETNGNTEEYERSFSFENIDDWRTEYWEKAKNGDIVPYRTKAMGSFGIKIYAVKEACLRGFRDFLLIGVTGGRLDHTLGNLYILKNLRERSAKAMIVDDMSEMELVGSETVETEDRFPLFSLIAIAGEARGVDISDAKYELKNGSILPSYQYGISNETLRGKTARVSVESGVLLLIRYRKGDV